MLSYRDKASLTMSSGEPPPLRRLAAVGCKLIAVWLMARAVEQLIGTVALMVASIANLPGVGSVGVASRMGRGIPAASMVMMAGPISAAAFLWFRADWMAVRMVPDDHAGVRPAGPGFEGLLSIGLAAVGAAVLVPAVRELAGALAITAQSHATVGLWWHDEYWVRAFWSAVAGTGLSAWLMFGNHGLVRLIVWARTAGRPVPPTVDQPAE